jgi:glycerol-3-phosphate cytidylyltransferase
MYLLTEQDLEDILRSFKLDVRIVEMRLKNFWDAHYCEEKKIELYFNGRDHRFSSSSLRKSCRQRKQNQSSLGFKSTLIDYGKTFNHACHYWSVGSRLWPLSRKKKSTKQF